MFELIRDLFGMITDKTYNVYSAELPDRKLLYQFAKRTYIDQNSLGNENTRDVFLFRLLKSPAILASTISTKLLWEKPVELCDRQKLLLQEQKARKKCNIITNESIAIAAKLSEHK